VVRAREYEVLRLAVEGGVELGWRHAHKHEDAPLVDDVKQRITEDVLNSICEWFMFEPFTKEEE
jgi:hypothetical protein